MWSTTFDAGNLHVRFDEGDVETGIADLGNKRHRLVATSRPTEMLHDGIYRATSLLYTYA
jgi:hypothetical protein